MSMPKKRRSIHGTSSNEVSDNVKNAAIQKRQVPYNNQEDSNDSDEVFSDDDEKIVLPSRTKLKGTPDESILRQVKSDFDLINDRLQRIQANENVKKKLIHNISIEQKIQKIIDNEKRLIKERQKNTSTIHQKQSNGFAKKCLLSSLILIPFIIMYNLLDSNTDNLSTFSLNKMFSTNEKSDSNIDPRLRDLQITLKKNRESYNSQDRNTWVDTYTSIKNVILDKEKPSIILMVGNKTATIDCLAQMVGTIASNFLDSDKLIIKPENFESDMGSVINMIRSKSKDMKAVVVSDLLNVNPEALKAFHNICDRINPLVKEMIYIFTIITENFENTKENIYKFVEDELFKKLSGNIKEDSIKPLITRITDGPILRIISEPHIKTTNNCPTIWTKAS